MKRPIAARSPAESDCLEPNLLLQERAGEGLAELFGTAPARHREPWLSLPANRPRKSPAKIAREIAQERGFAQTPFIAVEDNPGGRGWRRKRWPRLCNPRPHSAPAPPHRQERTRSDVYRLLSRSFRRRNARPGPSDHPAAPARFVAPSLDQVLRVSGDNRCICSQRRGGCRTCRRT